MKNSLGPMEAKNIVSHREFIRRIKKTLYYGNSEHYPCDRISRPLADYAAEMFSDTHKGTSLNRIDFATVSKLKITPCSLILSMIYLDRLNKLDPAYAHRITPSELFLVSMFTASKFLVGYDEFVYLSEWAEYGRMDENRLKELELEFLDAMNWSIFVSSHEFFEKLKGVEKVLAKRQGLKRGWLTYTELFRLMPTLALAKQILSYSTVLALSYCGFVATIASGFFLASQVPGSSLSKGGKLVLDQSSNATTSVGDRITDTDTGLLGLDDDNETETELIEQMAEDVNESIGRYEAAENKEVPETPTKNRTNMNQKLPDPGSGFVSHNRYDHGTCVNDKCLNGPNINSKNVKHDTKLKYYADSDGNYLQNCTQKSWLAELLSGQQMNPSFNTMPTVWLKFI